MYRKIRLPCAGMVGLSLGLGFGVAPGVVVAAGAQSGAANDLQIDAEIHKALDNKKYQNVTASVHDGNVTLTGTVDLYATRQEADKRAHHVQGVNGVDDRIEVAGQPVDDVTLREELAKALSYDRVGYGTTAFNDITFGVRNGVVTLGGTVVGPPDKASAMGLIANTAGVKDIVDNLQVAPLSPMDDRLRMQLARVIYGAPQLQKYAVDPAKPIRIIVANGNVTLTGVVENKMDHDLAGLRANAVPGVFKVVNNLQIAGPEPGK